MLRLVVPILLISSVASGSHAAFRPMQDLPSARVGQPYSAALNASGAGNCAIRGVAWALAAGRLPDGLDISGGKLAGTAREAGSWEFVLRASTACSDVIVPLRLGVSDSRQVDLISVHKRSLSR